MTAYTNHLSRKKRKWGTMSEEYEQEHDTNVKIKRQITDDCNSNEHLSNEDDDFDFNNFKLNPNIVQDCHLNPSKRRKTHSCHNGEDFWVQIATNANPTAKDGHKKRLPRQMTTLSVLRNLEEQSFKCSDESCRLKNLQQQEQIFNLKQKIESLLQDVSKKQEIILRLKQQMRRFQDLMMDEAKPFS